MSRPRVPGLLVTAAYLTGWRVLRMLPESAALRLFQAIADRIYAHNGRSVRRLRANLAHAVPAADLEAATAEAVRSYLRYWCEVFRLPTWTRAKVLSRTRVNGEQHLGEGLAAGKGVVVALPHMANWDWAGAWVCARHAPLMTVAERLEPARVFDAFVAFRESLGFTVLPLSGGEPPLPRLAQRLREGGLVCLLADRDMSSSAVAVDFLGSGARFPVGPAVLAERTGAALVAATLAYRGRDLEITFTPVPSGDTAERTQHLADLFAAGIAADPVDWHMMQRVFDA